MIHLYAEHLLNIRTLSIQASLSTVSNKETKAKLSADGSILTITHEGETASVTLPINLSPNRQSNVTLTIPAVPSRELTFRVELEAKEGVSNGVLSNGAPIETGNIVPWTANSLGSETEIGCKSCGCIFLERGKVREWKDLPSEGWAEMMEFWHCHKPDESHLHDHAQSKKGYAANSQLALESGVAMVDATDFLLASEDCKNITIGSASDAAEFLCRNCTAVIGRIELSIRGYKLRKHRLSVSRGEGHVAMSYDNDKWFSCLLLNAMDTQGVRKLVVYDRNSDRSQSLKLWIFAPDLNVSTSARLSPAPVRVSKILWKHNDVPANQVDNLNSSSLSEGELALRSGELSLLKGRLERSCEMLPEGARTFQEWHVGLLERFTAHDTDST